MRIAIADFAVLIAVVVMTIVDLVKHLNTPKLEVPQTFTVCISVLIILILFYIFKNLLGFDFNKHLKICRKSKSKVAINNNTWK